MSFGYTGHLIERELFGEATPEKNPEFKNRYVKFRDAMDRARGQQPKHETMFSKNLRFKVAEIMKLDDVNKLRVLTAVRTLLDKYHGVDAFLEYDLNQGKKVIVTLDVTANPDKGDDYKADITFYVPNDGIDPDLDKNEYDEKVTEVAQQIVDKIKESHK